MREIKFRCYDKNEGYMLPWEHLVGAGDLREMLLHGHEEDADYSKLMQYTGLKDKNGVEIYEGDIIENSRGTRLEVVFEYGNFKCKGIDVLNGRFFTDDLGEFSSWSVVKGNIYENPELLDNKK